jgi:hypothetical protein
MNKGLVLPPPIGGENRGACVKKATLFFETGFFATATQKNGGQEERRNGISERSTEGRMRRSELRKRKRKSRRSGGRKDGRYYEDPKLGGSD